MRSLAARHHAVYCMHTRLSTLLQATASAVAIAAAKAACSSIRFKRAAVTLPEMTALVALCRAALSSPDVCADFCGALASICDPDDSFNEANRASCNAARVIPAVVASMSLHGTVPANALNGCAALYGLAYDNTVNVDAIVRSDGGLDAIYSMMRSYPADAEMQLVACVTLARIVDVASLAAMRIIRESDVVELLNAAKRNHPSDEGVQWNADRALAALRG